MVLVVGQHKNFLVNTGKLLFTVLMTEVEHSITDTVDNLSNALSALNIDDKQKFESLNDNIKPKLSKSKMALDHIESTLKSSNYMTVTHRKYLRLMLRSLEPELLERQEFSCIFNSTTTSPHIAVDTRLKLLPLFRKWKEVLIEHGTQIRNKYFLYNGSLNPDFSDVLCKVGGCTYPLWFNDGFHISGSTPSEEFERIMLDYDPDFLKECQRLKITYSNCRIVNDVRSA